MANVILCGSDMRVLARWTDAMQLGGHDCRILPPASLASAATRVADAWLVDLGPRPVADHAHLIQALTESNKTAFIALTSTPTVAEGLKLLRAGVRGYANRQASPDVVDAIVTTVLDGQVWAGRQVTDHLLSLALQGPAIPPKATIADQLTAREVEIATDVAAGHSNKVIAVDHGISERTVKAHLNSVFRKTGIRNRVQLALALAREEPVSQRRSRA